MTWQRNRPTYGPEWRRIRKAVLEEEPFCRDCGQPATDVDHINGRTAGDDRSNLQSLCSRCHHKKTGRENGRKSPRRPAEQHPGRVGGSKF